jgi:hypothetical protein
MSREGLRFCCQQDELLLVDVNYCDTTLIPSRYNFTNPSMSKLDSGTSASTFPCSSIAMFLQAKVITSLDLTTTIYRQITGYHHFSIVQ